MRNMLEDIKYGAIMELAKKGEEPTKEEKVLALFLAKYQSSVRFDDMLTLVFVSGTTYDRWNLYLGGECIFGVQEASDGYIIDLSDPIIDQNLVALLILTEHEMYS